jgi:hypothetical protein
VYAQTGDASALLSLGWPPELHIAKTLSLASATSFLNLRPGCRHAQLKITYASVDAQVGGMVVCVGGEGEGHLESWLPGKRVTWEGKRTASEAAAATGLPCQAAEPRLALPFTPTAARRSSSSGWWTEARQQ